MNKQSKLNILPRALISIALIAVILSGGVKAFDFLKSLKKPPEQKEVVVPRTVVRVQQLTKQAYTEVFSGYGIARALRKTQVEAELPGMVIWLSPKLEAGGVVDAGEALVKLDDRDLVQAKAVVQAGVEQAQAVVETLRYELDGLEGQLKVARQELETARREEARLRSLAEKERVSASAVDKQSLLTAISEKAVVGYEMQRSSNRPATDRALAEIAMRQAQLKRAENDLSRATISAPYAGVIEHRTVQLGARVAPGVPLFRLIDLSRVEIPVSIPASHFGEVKVDSPARFRYRQENEIVWEGQVARVAPSVNSTDRTFHAYLDVRGQNNDAIVPEGAFVMADIKGPVYEDVYVIPRVAFVGDHVFVVERNEDGTAFIRKRVPVVAKLLPDVALVREGVATGDEVVVTNVEEIADGSRVKIVTEQAPLADLKSEPSEMEN